MLKLCLDTSTIARGNGFGNLFHGGSTPKRSSKFGIRTIRMPLSFPIIFTLEPFFMEYLRLSSAGRVIAQLHYAGPPRKLLAFSGVCES